ncbi:MAG TPA: DUF547 domain-containing protein [Cryomorphaceae bacterium]|nr:DUF547 domain-containing protein [Cryomorphaceae bacterium]
MTRFLSFLFSILLVAACSGVGDVQSDSKPVSHSTWDSLLKKHVNDQGMVDYKGFINDSTKLNRYLDLLENNHPNEKNWTRDERLAYWINAYNAFTIKLVTKHYPVESIKDIGSSINIPFVSTPWDIKFIEIEGKEYDLNNLEHGIIREEFEEPRIHFALVCAAMSCPKLRNEAYTAEKLDAQLEDEANDFFNSEKNDISADKAELSKLMKWYSGDFEDVAPSVIAYINRYSKTKINEDADIDYKDYSWKLNEQ